MPAADASTSVAMLRRFISAVGRTSRETKRPTLTASASAPLPTSVNCSKCLINLALDVDGIARGVYTCTQTYRERL